jgi:hypothetical protein
MGLGEEGITSIDRETSTHHPREMTMEGMEEGTGVTLTSILKQGTITTTSRIVEGVGMDAMGRVGREWE